MTDVMHGHFAVFGPMAEISNRSEGHFMERLERGSFRRTLAEDRSQIKVMFSHGADPDLGDKVLGAPSVLQEDEYGVYYEVPLFPSVPRLLVDGLRANQYGASFRFRARRDSWDERPQPSPENPKALPVRTVHEVELREWTRDVGRVQERLSRYPFGGADGSAQQQAG